MTPAEIAKRDHIRDVLWRLREITPASNIRAASHARTIAEAIQLLEEMNAMMDGSAAASLRMAERLLRQEAELERLRSAG